MNALVTNHYLFEKSNFRGPQVIVVDITGPRIF